MPRRENAPTPGGKKWAFKPAVVHYFRKQSVSSSTSRLRNSTASSDRKTTSSPLFYIQSAYYTCSLPWNIRYVATKRKSFVSRQAASHNPLINFSLTIRNDYNGIERNRLQYNRIPTCAKKIWREIASSTNPKVKVIIIMSQIINRPKGER